MLKSIALFAVEKEEKKDTYTIDYDELTRDYEFPSYSFDDR